jgi:zinc protease
VKQLLRSIERQYTERDKTESRSFAGTYVNAYLRDQPAPGVEWTYTMYQELLPKITLQEVNLLATQWMGNDENAVAVITAPDKEGVKIPSEERVKDIIRSAGTKEVKAYEDKTVDKPLLAQKPKGTSIASEKKIDDLQITEWTLANGARVILKPTDFKNDEILFRAFSKGGTSLYPDKDFASANYSNVIIDNSGAGDMDPTSLKKYLSDKVVNVYSDVSDLQEGIGGSCSPKDLETMLQLIYLKFTAPRKDESAFRATMSRQLSLIQNGHNDPVSALFDTMQLTMSQHHFRSRPEDENTLKEVNLDKAYTIFKDRFSNAGDFTFVFVGSFQPEKVKPLIETYIGGIPSTNKKEVFRDLGIVPPEGVITKEVKKGIEPQSYVAMVWTGPFQYNRYNRNEMISLQKLLSIKLRESLRENMGGVYGVRVFPNLEHYPREQYSWYVQFGCSPDNAGKLMKAVVNVIDSVKEFGCSMKDLSKIKELSLKEREIGLKQNGFWLSALESAYWNNENILELSDYNKQVESLTSDDFKRLAKKYFNMSNYATFVLYPEN